MAFFKSGIKSAPKAGIGGTPRVSTGALPAPKPPGAEGVFGGGGRFAKGGGMAQEVAGAPATADAVKQMYTLLASSPAFASMMRSALAGGSQANTAIQSSLGRTGMGSSGIGALTSGLATMLPGQAAQDVRGQTFAQAAGMGGDIISRLVQLFPELAKQAHRNYGAKGVSVGPVSVGGGLS